MSQGMMNRLFKMTSRFDKAYHAFHTNMLLSNTGAQATLYKDLYAQETHRADLFKREMAEREEEDVLERALLKAKNAYQTKALPPHEYFRIKEKVAALKKLRFAEGYEKYQDPGTYEWMKYKVAAEIGGQEEHEAFKLYEKIKIDEIGETKYALLKDGMPHRAQHFL